MTGPSLPEPGSEAVVSEPPPVRRSVSEEFLASPDVQAALADVIRKVPALLKQKGSRSTVSRAGNSTGQSHGRPVWSRSSSVQSS